MEIYLKKKDFNVIFVFFISSIRIIMNIYIYIITVYLNKNKKFMKILIHYRF